ncbi:MAG: membrane dipeptidase [Rhodobacteraceae bacterium]|nr:membrane dipeptidase [Paracoccaceae bacterium]
MPLVMDGLQYANWSETVFRQMRQGGIDAVHATVAYHGNFAEVEAAMAEWMLRCRRHRELILLASEFADLDRARRSSRTAIFPGLQNPSPIGDDLSLLEALYRLGVRFMQLTYNNQSLLGTGYMEAVDAGLTRMGREAVAEMNRLGMVIDLSHAGPDTALQAIEASAGPVAITHANPQFWHPIGRNIPDHVLKALAESGGMLGLSLYPLHLAGGSGCPLDAFCGMAAETAGRYGVEFLGIGSDLCQDRPAESLRWMRYGRWSLKSVKEEAFPRPVSWFQDNRQFPGLAAGLRQAGFSEQDAAAVLGENWHRFLRRVMVRG